MTTKKQVQEIEGRINAARITTLSGCIGETIKAIAVEDNFKPSEFQVLFESGKWLRLRARSYYEDLYLDIDEHLSDLAMLDTAAIGLLSLEESKLIIQYHESKDLEERRQRELAQLEELKAKYETKEPAST